MATTPHCDICIAISSEIPYSLSWVAAYELRLSALQIPPRRLFPLDRLEQRPKVPLAEAASALALDDFVEDRRPVLDRTGEDLEEVAVRVTVHEDAQRGEHVHRLVDLADPALQLLVVARRHGE